MGRLDQKLYASAEANNSKAAVRLGSDMGEFFMPYPGTRINQESTPLTGANGITGSASYYEVKFSDASKPNGQIWTGVVGCPRRTRPRRTAAALVRGVARDGERPGGQGRGQGAGRVDPALGGPARTGRRSPAGSGPQPAPELRPRPRLRPRPLRAGGRGQSHAGAGTAADTIGLTAHRGVRMTCQPSPIAPVRYAERVYRNDGPATRWALPAIARRPAWTSWQLPNTWPVHRRKTSVGWIGYIIIGGIAGWIAGKIVKGGGSGILMDIVIGVVGAFDRRLLPELAWFDVNSGGYWFTFFTALLGSVILLWIVGMVRRTR